MDKDSGDFIKNTAEGVTRGIIASFRDRIKLPKFKKRKYKIKDFDAQRTKNLQGTDFRELLLKGKYLEELEFLVNSNSRYWRAGIKILDSNASLFPLYKKDANLLIHLIKNPKSKDLNMVVYNDGKVYMPEKKLYGIAINEPIKFRLEINEKNYLKCYIGSNLEFSTRINSIKRKKAYLLAWADDKKYLVNFRKTRYKLV